MWHYLYFIVLIKVKDPTEFTGPESYVYAMVKVGHLFKLLFIKLLIKVMDLTLHVICVFSFHFRRAEIENMLIANFVTFLILILPPEVTFQK